MGELLRARAPAASQELRPPVMGRAIRAHSTLPGTANLPRISRSHVAPDCSEHIPTLRCTNRHAVAGDPRNPVAKAEVRYGSATCASPDYARIGSNFLTAPPKIGSVHKTSECDPAK